jgi:hypothetical protein
MNQFTSCRDAKKFLVAGILDEAQREGVPLSEVERKMLYFSETGWAPADIMETSGRFDRECDQPAYETKIARLIGNARERAREENQQEFDASSDAIGTLSKEDHYLLVMIQQAGGEVSQGRDLLRLWATAFAIVLGILFLMYVAGVFGRL